MMDARREFMKEYGLPWEAITDEHPDKERILAAANERIENVWPLVKRKDERIHLLEKRKTALLAEVEQLQKLRPIADAYQGVCRQLGVEGDLLGLFERRRVVIGALKVACEGAEGELVEYMGLGNPVYRCTICSAEDERLQDICHENDCSVGQLRAAISRAAEMGAKKE